MIGQKGFFKTNSNVNANLGDAIISSGSTPTPTPPPAPHIPNLPSSDATLAGNAQPAPAQTKKPLNIKTILIIIVAAIAGAGITVAVMLVIKKGNSEATHPVTVYTDGPGNDGTETIEDTLKEFDSKIEKSSDAEETFDLTLAKAAYEFVNQNYDATITILNGVNSTGLDDYSLYRLYNHYAGAYEAKGNAAEAKRYRAMADEAYARDFKNATEEAIAQ